MEFNESKMLQEQFMKMCATGKLFRSKVTGSQLWETYMRGFGEDPIFRDPESSVHNCNQCKHFFHRYGNIVAIAENLSIMTMFDAPVTDEYKESFRLMSEQLKNSEIEDVFVETFDYLNKAVYARVKKDDELFALNLDHTVKRYTKEEAEKFGVVKPNETRTFDHFCVRVPNQFISKTLESVDYLQAKYREDKNIFMRGLEEIPAETLKLVIDLIGQGSLLDGDTHKFKVVQFLAFAEQYANIPAEKRDNWCWVNSYKLNIARFKNELIGKLCIELAEGKELNKACQDWNIRVDPKNYMKATAPITQQMIDNAKAFIAEAGYEESFVRRCATIEDIKVSDILHVNTGDGKIKPVSILDGIKPTSTRHKRSEFNNVEVVPIEKFMKDILPGCTSVEVFLQNSQKNNFVTLTTPVNKDSLPIFKWRNNFGWTYNGNLAGKSEIKEALKVAREYWDSPRTCIDINVLPELFSELKENEDERIRKGLIKAFGSIGKKEWGGINVKNAIAWIEKQGEHANFRNKIQIGDKVTRNEDGVLVNLSQLNRVAKKQGEQKPIPKFKVGDVVRSSNGESLLIVGITDYCYNCVTCATNDEYSFGFDIQDEFELVEQKPTEWSEEDEDAIGMAIIALEDMYDEDAPNTTYGGYNLPFNKAAERLKSLKDRFTWKPSEGQMVALNCAITAASDDLVCLNVKDLESLYEQLKKLREE